jgi:hypothetical protein
MTNLLIVFDNVSQVVSARVMRFPNRHGIVRKVYITVVTEEFWHFGGGERIQSRDKCRGGAFEPNIKLSLGNGFELI